MSVTYDVRIWKTSVYEGQRRKTYKVRWVVAGKSHNRSFKTSAPERLRLGPPRRVIGLVGTGRVGSLSRP